MQHAGDLLVVETAKVSQLDNLAAPWIAFGQSLQCFVQTNQFAALIGNDCSNSSSETCCAPPPRFA
jgi:hypothetical protein